MGVNPYDHVMEERVRRTTRLKKIGIDYLKQLWGGCWRCGWNRTVWGLHFHHPAKDVSRVARRRHVTWTRIFEEIRECELLCANCRAEAIRHAWIGKHFLEQDWKRKGLI